MEYESVFMLLEHNYRVTSHQPSLPWSCFIEQKLEMVSSEHTGRSGIVCDCGRQVLLLFPTVQLLATRGSAITKNTWQTVKKKNSF